LEQAPAVLGILAKEMMEAQYTLLQSLLLLLLHVSVQFIRCIALAVGMYNALATLNVQLIILALHHLSYGQTAELLPMLQIIAQKQTPYLAEIVQPIQIVAQDITAVVII
jgi:hypothetical protein